MELDSNLKSKVSHQVKYQAKCHLKCKVRHQVKSKAKSQIKCKGKSDLHLNKCHLNLLLQCKVKCQVKYQDKAHHLAKDLPDHQSHHHLDPNHHKIHGNTQPKTSPSTPQPPTELQIFHPNSNQTTTTSTSTCPLMDQIYDKGKPPIK